MLNISKLVRYEIFKIAFLFLFTFLSRLFFISKLIFHSDTFLYIDAMTKFNPAQQKPHPPGYILYVMMARLLDYFVQDAHKTLLIISILFSALAVIIFYLLAKSLFGNTIGFLSSFLLATSPLFWFNGEIAMPYTVEVFFATLIAYFCYETFRGREKFLFPATFSLAIAGGMRQNILFWLLPLWIFSIRKYGFKRIVLSFLILILIVLLWFIPMALASGGIGKYLEALEKQFLGGGVARSSIFAKEAILSNLLRNFNTIKYYTLLTWGLMATFFIELALILFILFKITLWRKRLFHFSFNQNKCLFFAGWLLVPFTFMLFVHITNSGHFSSLVPLFIIGLIYFLIFSVKKVCEVIAKGLTSGSFKLIFLTLVVVVALGNIIFFIKYPSVITSAYAIEKHNKLLKKEVDIIRERFSSQKTIFLVSQQHSLYNFHLLGYYFPEYGVYEIFTDRAIVYPSDKIFRYANHGETYFKKEVAIDDYIDQVVFSVYCQPEELVPDLKINSIVAKSIFLDDKCYIVYFDISNVSDQDRLFLENFINSSKYN